MGYLSAYNAAKCRITNCRLLISWTPYSADVTCQSSGQSSCSACRVPQVTTVLFELW